MRIVLEQQTGSTFRVVSPQHVFKTGDMVRFRVLSSSDGFLYVSDRAASGKYSELFPVKGADSDNRLEHGREYRIPAASRSWFRIEKPAGYETVFFTFTYSPLPRRSEAAPTFPATAPKEPLPQTRPAELIPRCDDALFRARGECLDVNAGPSAVPARHSWRVRTLLRRETSPSSGAGHFGRDTRYPRGHADHLRVSDCPPLTYERYRQVVNCFLFSDRPPVPGTNSGA